MFPGANDEPVPIRTADDAAERAISGAYWPQAAEIEAQKSGVMNLSSPFDLDDICQSGAMPKAVQIEDESHEIWVLNHVAGIWRHGIIPSSQSAVDDGWVWESGVVMARVLQEEQAARERGDDNVIARPLYTVTNPWYMGKLITTPVVSDIEIPIPIATLRA